MSLNIQNKILEHKENINKLNEKLILTKDKNEQWLLNIEINSEQNLIISLLEILQNLPQKMNEKKIFRMK